ncbi:hypothetical protein D9758_001064 [Tetrapyrgos nigripes]|uniref:Uncharacterized protein n=1 Tax=Tetrapyrgos nigripes TaxID=182062 RepID=A0A8H5GS23_9AGAR|nr:hypothetical protein D9758_001064 [Tetrapyrgos nigripes]
MAWKPVRTIAECDKILSGPGSIFEVETLLIDGRVQRAYKNLWPSMRAFLLWSCNEFNDKVFIVSEEQQYTYRELLERSAKTASIFRNHCGVEKGDSVGICSRNYPEYLVMFWACHLLGAVPVLVNAWLPLDGIRYCVSLSDCKILILDPERASVLEPEISQIVKDIKLKDVFVLESHEGKGVWAGMSDWKDVYNRYRGDFSDILNNDPHILPEDNAAVYFTSGTTGRPKGVLSSQRQYLTNVFNSANGRARDALRQGIELPDMSDPQKGMLSRFFVHLFVIELESCAVSVPFFHVTGTTSQMMSSMMNGLKIVLLRRWVPEEAVKYGDLTQQKDISSSVISDRLIKKHNVAVAGGVPSMVMDLLFRAGEFKLESLTFGGASASPSLAETASRVLPEASLGQGYGMTECNSVAVGIVGKDQVLRPASTGLPTLVNDLLVMDLEGTKAVPPNTLGEVWIRGVNVMKGYLKDPEATDRTVTKDGWLKTGDLGYLDEEGFLFIKDRIKDIIIRGGENIDSISVENAFYALPSIYEAAAVGVPDPKLGELVAVVASLKPEYHGKVTERELIHAVQKSLPRFAVPSLVVLQNEPLGKCLFTKRTASGKIVKAQLRMQAAKEWEKRQGGVIKTKL